MNIFEYNRARLSGKLEKQEHKMKAKPKKTPDAARAASFQDTMEASRGYGPRHKIPADAQARVASRAQADLAVDSRRKGSQYRGKQKVNTGLTNARKTYGRKPT